MKSGDILFIERYDGVDPMINWGMGVPIGKLFIFKFNFIN